MNLEQPSSIGRSLITLGDHLSNLRLLWSRELRTASSNSAFLASGIQSRLGSLSEHRSFEFSERPDHLHHHSPGRCGCIDGFGQAAESRFHAGKPLHDYQHVAQRTR